MATKSTNKTLWTLAIIAILGFLAWKLWPAIRNKLNSGGGSGGGGPVGGIPGGYNPYGGGGQPGGGSFSGGPGLGNPNNPGGGGNFLSNWINSVLNQGYANADAIDQNSITDSDFANELAQLDTSGLDLPAPSSDDESWGSYLGSQDGLFLQTFDAPGDYDNSGFGYNYNGAGDDLGSDDGDYNQSGFGYGYSDQNGESDNYGSSYGGEEVPGENSDPNTSYYS
jgi:hypothetical protein